MSKTSYYAYSKNYISWLKKGSKVIMIARLRQARSVHNDRERPTRPHSTAPTLVSGPVQCGNVTCCRQKLLRDMAYAWPGPLSGRNRPPAQSSNVSSSVAAGPRALQCCSDTSACQWPQPGLALAGSARLPVLCRAKFPPARGAMSESAT